MSNLCSACDIEIDSLNNKKRELRNLSEQQNKQLYVLSAVTFLVTIF